MILPCVGGANVVTSTVLSEGSGAGVLELLPKFLQDVFQRLGRALSAGWIAGLAKLVQRRLSFVG